MDKEERFLIGVFIAAALLSLLGLLYSVTPARAASDKQAINTTFEQGCIEPLDAAHYRLHVFYTSDGVEMYHFTMGQIVGNDAEAQPYGGTVTTNIPDTFTTSVGEHDDFYLEGQSEDSSYEFTLLFTNDVGTAVLPISTWGAQSACSDPVPAITPEPTQNPANANVSGMQAISQPLPTSSAAMCVIKYPQIILVCNR